GAELGRAAALPDTAEALLTLARLEDMRGETAEAALHREEALDISRRMSDHWSSAFVLNQLGLQARRAAQLERAEALLAESAAVWGESRRLMGQRAALMNLVLLYLERGAVSDSISRGCDMLDLCRELGDTSPTTARCVEIAAQVLGAVGWFEEAVLLLHS